MMNGDFGRCSDASCNARAARLFRCAHHCTQMLCLEHLIEHEHFNEPTRFDYENVQEELKTFAKIYSSFVNEEKLRFDFEEKLDEHRRIVDDVKILIENHFDDVERIRSMIERLKKSIEKREKSSSDALTIVKVEPVEEMNTSSKSENDLVSIGFDRLQNLIIDTDFHRRQSEETPKIKSENSRNLFSDQKNQKSLNVYIRNVSGNCPLWCDGSFGLTEENHGIRLCSKKRFSDLNDHIRRFHGLLSPVAYFLTRATQMNISTEENLFPSDLQVVDPHRTFLCPMKDQCQMRSWIPGGCLKRHLVSVHHMNTLTAQITTNNVKTSNRSKSTANIRSRAFEIIRQLDLPTGEEVRRSAARKRRNR